MGFISFISRLIVTLSQNRNVMANIKIIKGEFEKELALLVRQRYLPMPSSMTIGVRIPLHGGVILLS